MECKWSQAPLGELISYISKGIVPKYTDDIVGSTIVLGQRCVRNQRVDYTQARFHDQKTKPFKPEKTVVLGDILINATGVGSAGRVAQVTVNPQQNCVTDGHVITLRAKGINPFYLGYFLKSRQSMIEQMAEGSTGQTEMNRSRLQNEIVVTFPQDNAAQTAIAQFGLSVDRKIAINNQINGYLGELVTVASKKLYWEYETSGTNLPAGWQWVHIEDIAKLVSRGIAPKYNEHSNEIVLGQTCIRGNLVLVENGRRHCPKRINEKWLQRGDLLINSTGVGSLGRTAQVWFDPEKLTVDSHITIVRTSNSEHALYLGFWAFAHERYIEALHTGSTGQTELPRDNVKSMSLVLPDAETLDRFNTIAKPAVKAIVANQAENKQLSALRDALLPRLMSGEIDVSRVDLTQLNSHLA